MLPQAAALLYVLASNSPGLLAVDTVRVWLCLCMQSQRTVVTQIVDACVHRLSVEAAATAVARAYVPSRTERTVWLLLEVRKVDVRCHAHARVCAMCSNWHNCRLHAHAQCTHDCHTNK
jgi:hypothetical protein